MAVARGSACVLGMGSMGSAMARCLRDKGCSVNVWNRSPAKAVALAAEAGAAAAPCFAAAAATEAVTCSEPRAPVLCVLSDTAAVCELLRSEGFGTSLQGRTFVNLASGNPDEGRDIAKVHAEVVGSTAGSCFIDGAYCGAPTKARQGAGQLFLSSDSPDAVQQARAVLDLLGSVTFAGGIGASRAMDYAVVDLFFVNLLAFISNKEALEREGVDIKQLIPEMKKRLDSVPAALEAYNARMAGRSQESYDSNITATLGTARSYWASRLPYMQTRGIPTDLTDLMLSLLDEASGGKDGPHSGSDVSRLQEVVRYRGQSGGGGPGSSKP